MVGRVWNQSWCDWWQLNQSDQLESIGFAERALTEPTIVRRNNRWKTNIRPLITTTLFRHLAREQISMRPLCWLVHCYRAGSKKPIKRSLPLNIHPNTLASPTFT